MIGQKDLLYTIDDLISNDIFPHFCILVGPTGSGKKTMAEYIARNLRGITLPVTDVKIDTIRCMIENSYKMCNRTVHIISDADKMSLAAKNAMLKIVEEPPNDAFFIMTLTDKSNTLATILSRATVFKMQPYTSAQLTHYAVNVKSETSNSVCKKLVEICDTCGDIDTALKVDVEEFYAYVESVVENIHTVSGANSFKIGTRLALKDDADGYDLKLFWKAFMAICMKKLADTKQPEYARGVSITSACMSDLKITGVNRQSLFDYWILRIREAWFSLTDD